MDALPSIKSENCKWFLQSIACQTHQADLAALVAVGVVHLKRGLSLRSR
jgi:hypothetical protein